MQEKRDARYSVIAGQDRQLREINTGKSELEGQGRQKMRVEQ
jgi:hypothetical protein